MNLVDVAIIALVIASAAHGFFRGAAVQLCSFVGFWGGLVVGAFLAPVITARIASDIGKTVVAVVVVFGLAIVLGGVGERIGGKIRTSLRVVMLGPVDSGAGAGIGVIATLLAIWLMSAMVLAVVKSPSVTEQLSQSVVVRTLTRALPPAPAVFAKVGHFLTPTGIPALFTGLEPVAPPPVPVPADPVVRAAVDAAQHSTVKVEGYGCGGIKSGSGFVVAPGVVVTNAHVVSGIALPEVYDVDGGRHPDVTVVLFDPEVDLAVLKVRGLNEPTLTLDRAPAARGVSGAVLGYPGGGSFTYVPAAVLNATDAIGHDIYGHNITTRSVYTLQADVRPGNSGGPFVAQDGHVEGVVFAASTALKDIGYALTGAEVGQDVDKGESASQEVSTRSCND